MRSFFVLLIFVPLFVTIKIPFTDWTWDLNIDWSGDFLKKLQTGVPQFIENMQSDLIEFYHTFDESKKEKIIEELKEKAMNTFEKFKQLTENKEKVLKQLIEEATKTAKYLSYKICDAAKMESYEECRNNKKAVFRELIGIIKEEFQCSKIVQIITEQLLNENIEDSIKYILFLADSITSNPDAIEEGKAQVIYDLMYCLQEQLKEHWGEIQAKLSKETNELALKKDITFILIQSIENLVGIIHFEEIDEFIKKADEKTGLISSDSAKEIHRHIFEMLEKLNKFGEGFYNFSATLAVNVTMRPTDLNVDNEIIMDFKEKGIKISLHGDYLFDIEKEANSIQSVVFDSPLVSIRGRRETDGGTANTFVGITLYGKDDKKIEINDINLENLRPIIYYKKSLFKAMTTCLFYNEEKETIENTGIETQIAQFNGEEYIACIPKHLTSFTIGSYKSASISNKSNTGIIILVIFLCLLVLGGGLAGYFFWRKRHYSDNSFQMNQAFPNKDGLIS